MVGDTVLIFVQHVDQAAFAVCCHFCIAAPLGIHDPGPGEGLAVVRTDSQGDIFPVSFAIAVDKDQRVGIVAIMIGGHTAKAPGIPELMIRGIAGPTGKTGGAVV